MSLVVQDNLSISLCFVYLQAPMVLTEAKSIDARVGEDSLAVYFLIKAVVRQTRHSVAKTDCGYVTNPFCDNHSMSCKTYMSSGCIPEYMDDIGIGLLPT